MLCLVKDQFTSKGIVLDNAIAFWVHRVYQAQRNELYRVFREHGHELTPEQWSILVRLWEADGRTQNDLAEATFRDKPTMSRMIDGLENLALVERRENKDDKRVRKIHLTAAGKALEKVLVPLAQSIVKRGMQGIPEEDLLTTRKTLQRMFLNFE